MDNFSVVHVGRYEGNRLYVIPEEETGISFFIQFFLIIAAQK